MRTRYEKGKSMKIVVFTLGCKVNECESDSLITGLKARGHDVTDELCFADLYIVNTCAITADAEKKSRQTSSRIYRLNPNASVIYTGCAAQKDPDSFIKKKNTSLVTGVFNKGEILSMLGDKGVKISDSTDVFEDLPDAKSLKDRTYVKVQDGCNNFCSYCIVPYLRGRSRSRSIDKIVDEVKGVSTNEIVINGINLSAYNDNGRTLTDLIKALSFTSIRLRLGSLEVGVIDDEFLTALMGLKNFAPHFHLSLQSGSDNVLKKMNRHYSRDEFISKVDLIRRYFPDAGITTDIIVGFPTETEEDFCDTMSLVDRVKFSDIHPFIFSPRQGTVAFKMKDLQYQAKKERLDRLIEKKKQCKLDFALSQKGKTLHLLLEEEKDGFYEGYSENYLRLYVKTSNASGKMVKVRVLDPFKDGATCEIID